MRIKKIHISRMPGFRTGPDYSKLASNVNVIAGPNGTGKSSTARVIRNLLWWNKNDSEGVKAEAEITLQDQAHTVRIDWPQYTHIRGNERVSGDFSEYVPTEFSRHYTLALHDLIKEENNDLAENIDKELKGGIDLNRAIQEAGYGDSINLKGNNAFYTAFVATQKAYNEILSGQEKLKNQEATLDKLNDELTDAKEADRLAEMYRQLSEYKMLDRQSKDIEELLATRSPHLEHLQTDDMNDITVLEKAIGEGRIEIVEIENRIRRSQEKIQKLSVYGADVTDQEWETLKVAVDAVSREEKRIEDCRLEIAKCKATREKATQELFSGKPEEEWGDISIPPIRELEKLVNEANKVSARFNQEKAEKVRLEEQIVRLKRPETIDEPISERAYEDGINALSQWLKAGDEPIKQSPVPAILLTVAAILTIIGLYFYPSAIIAIGGFVIVLAVFLYFLRNQRKNSGGDRLKHWEEVYTILRLQTPEKWESLSVVQKLDQLITDLNSVREWKIRQDRLALMLEKQQQEYENVSKEWNDIVEEYNKRVDALGISPAEKEQDAASFTTLLMIVQQLSDYKQAATKLREAEAGRSEAEQLMKEALNLCNAWLERYHLGEVNNTAEAVGLWANIVKERDLLQKESDAIYNDRQSLQIREKTLSEKEEALSAIYHRIGLTEAEKDSIRELIKQLPEYKETKEKQERLRLRKQSRLEELRQISDYKEDLLLLSSDEIIERLDVYKQKAEKKDSLLKDVSRINTLIDEEKKKDALEKAIVARDNATQNLEQAFREAMQKRTGQLLAEQLQQRVVVDNNNKVFRMANDILKSITEDKFSLLLGEEKGPVFEAYDVVNDQKLSLKKISTGTRVQLLLAIRLAYIQAQEKEVNMPIIADELLANSDDQRSETIIQSLIEISKTRQLFYFTAQADEVAKWKSILQKQSEVEHKIIFLDEAMKELPALQQEKVTLKLSEDVPAPEGLSHAEYRNILTVPEFDLMEHPISSLHIWYLIEDVSLLYQFLKQNLVYWGQLESYITRLKERNLVIKEDEWELIKRKVSLLTYYCSLYKIGRSRKIDKEVLMQLNISDAFFDQALELLDRNKGETLSFLQELFDLKGFRSAKKKEIEDTLLSMGYTDNQPQLSTDDLNIRMAVRATELGLDAGVAEYFLQVVQGIK